MFPSGPFDFVYAPHNPVASTVMNMTFSLTDPFTREEVAKVVSLLDGEAQTIVKLLYGSGLRIMEAVRLRVKDVDFQMKQVTVRSGKGDKDRFTTLPVSLINQDRNNEQRHRSKD
jgi:site-specific recombinase XerD